MIAITSLIGIFAVAAALEGYLFSNMGIIDRLLLVAGGLMMIVPGTMTDLIGLALIAAGIALQYVMSSRHKA
jgi:TRAP-type uncharacterized transport system fused permease subunit